MMNMEMEALVWERAAKSRAIFHVIHDDDIWTIDDLLRSAIQLAGDDQTLKKTLWGLRLSALQTCLPLGAEELGLADNLKSAASSRLLRSLQDRFDKAFQLVQQKKNNLKREALDTLYCESNEDINVWIRPWNQTSAGWPRAMEGVFRKDYGNRVRIIQGIRDLPLSAGHLVLVAPLHGQRFPLTNAMKLLRPGRWSVVHVLRYDLALESDRFTRGALEPPVTLRFWVGEWEAREQLMGQPHQQKDPCESHAELEENDSDLDPRDIFGVVDSRVDEPVDACIVQLSSGFCVAYAVDEPIKLLNRSREWIPALSLEESDLIPVGIDDVDRQSLELAAVGRLGKDNADSVKRRIRAWKQVVRNCLNRFGEERFGREFKNFVVGGGEAWRDDAWSSETPWAPRGKQDFEALIRAAHALGFFRGEDVDQLVASSWRDVQVLRNAHRLAGRDIVHRLEDELEQKVSAQAAWKAGDEVGLESGGRKYRVFEVLAVRKVGKLHPYQLNRVKKWQS